MTRCAGRDRMRCTRPLRRVWPDARRIYSTDFGPGGLETVAFRNPDCNLVPVALNSAGASQAFAMQQGEGQFRHSLPARSIATFLWSPSVRVGRWATYPSTTASD